LDNISFVKAFLEDAAELTAISIRAFHSDVSVGSPEEGGPPGYNSINFHKKMIEESTLFYKIICGIRTIGGFWFFRKGSDTAYFARIFIDTEFQRNGVGIDFFEFLFKSYPAIKQWTLETPPVAAISRYRWGWGSFLLQV